MRVCACVLSCHSSCSREIARDFCPPPPPPPLPVLFVPFVSGQGYHGDGAVRVSGYRTEPWRTTAVEHSPGLPDRGSPGPKVSQTSPRGSRPGFSTLGGTTRPPPGVFSRRLVDPLPHPPRKTAAAPPPQKEKKRRRGERYILGE